MKIAFVVHDYHQGYGHGRYVCELARQFASEHEVEIWANRFKGSPEGNMRFRHVPAFRRTALTSVLTFLFSATRKLAASDFDIVHGQGLCCWGATVLTAHICNAARLERNSSASERDRFFLRLISVLETGFYRKSKARHLIAVSNQVQKEIALYYGWKGQSSVIYHGINTAQFQPPNSQERIVARKKFELEENGWVWLFIGEANKGLERAIQQLSQFPSALLLAVSRSNLMRYKRLAGSLGVQNRIRFCPGLEEIHSAYHAADLFLYPSQYDAFGLVVAEAMACGLPIIAGERIGAAEWIVPGQNGWLCDPERPRSIRNALEKLRCERGHAGSLGRSARATVEPWTWKRCAEATAQVYEEVLKQEVS